MVKIIMKSKKIEKNEWWRDHGCYLRVEKWGQQEAASRRSRQKASRLSNVPYGWTWQLANSSVSQFHTPLAHGTSFSKSWSLLALSFNWADFMTPLANKMLWKLCRAIWGPKPLEAWQLLLSPFGDMTSMLPQAELQMKRGHMGQECQPGLSCSSHLGDLWDTCMGSKINSLYVFSL